MEFMMHKGMEGPHDFRVKVVTNDPVTREIELVVLSDWRS
jgi:hypothetical protein